MRLNFLARTGLATAFALALSSSVAAQSSAPAPAATDPGQW